MSKGRRGLGRGLDALLQSTQEPAEAESRADAESSARTEAMRVAIGAIQPNPYQPRQHFDERALDELADSIREHGLIQPLLVRPEGEGYVLIAGERRWQASQRAGLQEVPVVLREATPQQMLALAIIENVQRADLDPIEAAAGYRRLMDEFELTQTEVARLVGKSRAALANTVRLLGLEADVRSLVSEGHLSEGHARALLPLDGAAEQLAMARQAISGGWTVRRIEEAVRAATHAGDLESESRDGAPRKPGRPALDPDTKAAIAQLEASLGTRVEIQRSGDGGRLVLHFYSEEELSALYNRLT